MYITFSAKIPRFSPQNFAVELTLESLSELDVEAFRQELIKAGGANYGTGIRE